MLLGVSTRAGANVRHRPGGEHRRVATLADAVDAVIGVDAHTDTRSACLLDPAGRELASLTVQATPDRYAAPC